MEIPLTNFEIEVLNHIVPGKTLDNPQGVRFAINNLIDDHKNHLMTTGNLSAENFRLLQEQTGRNILKFLKENGFYHEREEGTIILTEKMKRLRLQGSIDKYYDWEKLEKATKAEEMRAIESRGYINKDQNPKEHHDTIYKETKTLDNDDKLKNHPPMPSHKFTPKPVEPSVSFNDKARKYYPALIALLVLGVVVLARYFKIV